MIGEFKSAGERGGTTSFTAGLHFQGLIIICKNRMQMVTKVLVVSFYRGSRLKDIIL